MNFMTRVVRVGLPTLGLTIGLLCLGRAFFVGAIAQGETRPTPALETALDKNLNRLNKRETITVGLLLGIPCTFGSLRMLTTFRRNHKLAQSQRLQVLFYKAIKANNGRINALQLAMLAEISVQDAKTFLDAWAGPLHASYQIDETGLMVYCFNASKTDRSNRLDP